VPQRRTIRRAHHICQAFLKKDQFAQPRHPIGSAADALVRLFFRRKLEYLTFIDRSIQAAIGPLDDRPKAPSGEWQVHLGDVARRQPIIRQLHHFNALTNRCFTEANTHMQVSNIEKKLGTRYTVDTIRTLQSGMPRTRFLWIMGADNLASFHTWERWNVIADAIPIAIFDRPGYGWSGLKSQFCLRYEKNQVAPKNIFNSGSPAWTFVTIPRHSASATEIRAKKLAKKLKKAKATNAKET